MKNNFSCKATQLLPLIIILAFSSCSGGKVKEGNKESVKTFNLGSIESLAPLKFSKKISEYVEINLLDVRTADEYAGGHLEHAANLDVSSHEFEKNILMLKKEIPVFLYCRSGSRSFQAAETLQDLGFKQIYTLDGGAVAWQSAGLALITPSSPKNKGMSIKEYRKLTSSSQLVLVDFSAVWCGPCRQLKPIIQEIATKNKDVVKLIEVDVDENPLLASEINISSIPALNLYKNGNKVWSIIGFDENTEASIYKAILKNK
ncbi:MAG: thioredoxin [Flavobacteriaceae bacterium]|nr:thioredoxin [Flavobacteriaceae bacterium]